MRGVIGGSLSILQRENPVFSILRPKIFHFSVAGGHLNFPFSNFTITCFPFYRAYQFSILQPKNGLFPILQFKKSPFSILRSTYCPPLKSIIWSWLAKVKNKQGTTSKFDGNSLSLQCKDRSLYPLPRLSLQPNLYSLPEPNPSPRISLHFKDREFPSKFDVALIQDRFSSSSSREIKNAQIKLAPTVVKGAQFNQNFCTKIIFRTEWNVIYHPFHLVWVSSTPFGLI